MCRHLVTASSIIVFTIFVFPILVFAGTWRVELDGSGDFSVIQGALDVAADGDTILIGPGEYLEETTFQVPSWGFDVRAYGRVVSDNLTIIGAGVGQTVVGPMTYVPDDQYYNPKGFASVEGGKFSVSDLSIRNCRYGIWMEGTLFCNRIEAVDNLVGVEWWTVEAGGWIKDTYIRGATEGFPLSIAVYGSGSNVLVEGCTFENAEATVKHLQGIRFSNCIIRDYLRGIRISGYSRVEIEYCDLSNIGEYGVGFSYLGGHIEGYCEIRNSVITGDDEALRTNEGSQFVVDNSILTGGARAVLYANDDPRSCTIHNCNLIKGAGPIVRCENTTYPVTHDLTNNYWGTTDAAEIEQWIIDITDDPGVQATVQFDPFFLDSVSVEGGKKSFGGLKAMFR